MNKLICINIIFLLVCISACEKKSISIEEFVCKHSVDYAKSLCRDSNIQVVLETRLEPLDKEIIFNYLLNKEFSITRASSIVYKDNLQDYLFMTRFSLFKKHRLIHYEQEEGLVSMTCFKEYMDSVIYAKYGKDFYKKLYAKTDSIYLVNSHRTELIIDGTYVNYLDTYPSFPGGDEMFYEYFSNFITRNKVIIEENIISYDHSTEIFLIIDEDGNIDKSQIINHQSKIVDSLTTIMINNMPKWEPAYYNGKKVRSTYNLRVNYDWFSCWN